MITGPAAEWLASNRSSLNQEFERARRQWSTLDGARFAASLEQTLPPFATGQVEEKELFHVLYRLLLIHNARDAFGRQPGLPILFRESFLRLRPLLLQRPAAANALSNAVENLGARGEAFARAIADVGETVESAHQLLQAGAVLAWRLGEPRLRGEALRLAPELPAPALLRALELRDWPPEAAFLAVPSLRGDAWRLPAGALSARTLEALRRMSGAERLSLARRLEQPDAVPLSGWTVVGRAGEFAGFGGVFGEPPTVLDGGDRHQLFAHSDGQTWRVEADCFGWVCRPQTDLELPTREPRKDSVLRRTLGRLNAGSESALGADGTLELGGERFRFDSLREATSFAVLPQAVAFGTRNSHRIRILAPSREPL